MRIYNQQLRDHGNPGAAAFRASRARQNFEWKARLEKQAREAKKIQRLEDNARHNLLEALRIKQERKLTEIIKPVFSPKKRKRAENPFAKSDAPPRSESLLDAHDEVAEVLRAPRILYKMPRLCISCAAINSQDPDCECCYIH